MSALSALQMLPPLADPAPRILNAKDNGFNTNPHVVSLVCRVGHIGLDPCSNPHSLVNAEIEWSLENGHDGLAEEWECNGLVFVNPGYSNGTQGKWVRKMACEAWLGVPIIGLLQANTCTKWFRQIYDTAQAICFWYGRMEFIGGKDSTGQFSSALPYWGPNAHLFAHVFSPFGHVEIL